MRVDCFLAKRFEWRQLMRDKFLIFAASLALSATLTLSGCKSSAPAPAPAAAPAPVATSDGTAAPASSTAPTAPPAGTAAAPVASVAASAPLPPPPPPPIQLIARAGTPVTVTITERLAASQNNVGDRFTGVLAAPVRSSGGGVIFPRGARVMGTVVASKGQGKFKGSGALGIQVTSISGTPVSVSSYETEQQGKGKRSAGFIGGGAGGGALIGALAGGGKGALIGGLIGAGAGTAGAAFTGNKDVVIASESTITFHLTAPVSITVQPK
jgi:hypothetical protein